MSLFGAIVKTVVNVATLPAAIVADIVTLGDCGGLSEEGGTFTTRKLKQIKDEANDD